MLLKMCTECNIPFTITERDRKSTGYMVGKPLPLDFQSYHIYEIHKKIQNSNSRGQSYQTTHTKLISEVYAITYPFISCLLGIVQKQEHRIRILEEDINKLKKLKIKK